MSRRGLSDIVTTILIILVALVAITVIWNVALPLMEKASGLDSQAYTTKLAVSADSVSYDPNTDSISLNVARDAGDGDIAGFLIGLTDPAGNVKTFRQNFTIAEYEAKNFQLNYSDQTIDDVLFVTITPIFRQNTTNKETYGIPIQQPVKNKTSYRLPSGLVAYWKMDGNWADSQGSYILTPNPLANPAPFLDSSNKKIGSASGNFDGTTYSHAYNNTDVNSLNYNSFTVIAWVNPSSLAPQLNRIIEKATTTGGFRLRYTAGAWQFITHSATAGRYNNVSITVPQADNLNKWQFLAATYTSNGINLTLNDVANSTIPAYSYTAPTSASLVIGQTFTGNIDEIMIFNRALNFTEINDIRRKYKG
jgi:hypothetical protein